MTTHPRLSRALRGVLFLAVALSLLLAQTGALAAPLSQTTATPDPFTPTASPSPEPPIPSGDAGATATPSGEANATPTPDATATPDVSPTLLPPTLLPPTPTLQPAAPLTDDESLAAALQAALAARQEMSIAYLLFQVKIDRIQYSSDKLTALVWLAFADPQTGQVAASEPGLAIATRAASTSKTWNMTLQVDPTWGDALNRAPNALLGASAKAQLRPANPDAVRAQSGTVFSGYKLPWAGGTSNYVTGSIGHVLTYKSCPTTCMYAFDFADGTMFPVHAAKAGRVRFAQWTYPNGNTTNANYLVLEDASTVPTTYQVYYHLAQNSIPAALRVIGAPVNQGQFIALADDTGLSTGHHLHFHVHTAAGQIWGTSVDITFADVPINGGRPRTCSEASTFPEYGAECMPGNKLLSGNTTGPLPPAPAMTAPSGTVKTSTPAFQWKAISGGLQYYLYANKVGATTATISTLVNASACQNGVCAYTPASVMADGSYQVKVRAGSATGWSGFSAALSFTINTAMGIPALVSPTGTISVNNPAYTWKAVPGATQYYLMVYSNASATYIIYRPLAASAACVGDTCSYVSTITLKHGGYKFKVRAGNAAGAWGSFSPLMSFNAYLAPLPPNWVEPASGSKVITPRPKYAWDAPAGAVKYHLQVYSVTRAVYVATYELASIYVCTGTACWFRPSLNLTPGSYKVRIRAYSDAYGYGDFTAWQAFTVQLIPDPPTLVSPVGTISTLSPAYTWTKVSNATAYYLMVWSDTDSAYIIYRTLYPANVCGTDTCSYTSTANVENGKSYRFVVRSYNSYGWGKYSPWTLFNVSP